MHLHRPILTRLFTTSVAMLKLAHCGARVTMIDLHRQDLVLTVWPGGVTGHPDHRRMHEPTAAALARPGWVPDRALGAVLRAEASSGSP